MAPRLGRLWLAALALALALALGPRAATADPRAPTFADVTPRAAVAIWAASLAVVDADVSLFDDDGGVQPSAGVTARFASGAASAGRGLARVELRGLVPDTCYFAQTRTDTAVGSEVFPAQPPLPVFCTPARLTRSDQAERPLANDLLHVEGRDPDGSAADGAIVLVAAPGLSAYPLATTIGDGTPSGTGLVGLNNLFARGTGATTSVPALEVLELREIRGLACPDPEPALLLRFRRAPVHEEQATLGVAISELELPAACEETDTACDGRSDILDVQRILHHVGVVVGDCAWNEDLDLTPDGVVDVEDARVVLDRMREDFLP